MTDIKDFILQLEDTTLSLEEQQSALAMIEQSLIENKQIQEKTLEENSDLIIDAVKVVEDRLDAKFTALKTDPKLKGPKGDQGIRGENGKTGRDGINGRDGIDGKDGVDGVDGKDGRYVVGAEIDLDDTLLITLSDGTQIKTTKEIKGPKGDPGPQGLRGSNGNGVVVGGAAGQVLTKVSDTDYDVTWSTNGAGTVTSITAGTGLSGGTITGTGTIAIDSTVATLDGSQTLTNKTLTSPTVNTPVVTGGTINNTVIGGTTPAAGTFTTITGQTEVLRGTGQNFFLYSQEFENTSGWTKEQSGTGVLPVITANADVAPDGTTTADQIVFSLGGGTTSSDFSWIRQSSSTTPSYVVGITYIQSVWMRTLSGTASVIMDLDSQNSNIASVTTTWQRFTFSRTAATAGTRQSRFGLRGATGSSATATVLMWGAQFEIGSTANTYIPTTTTAVYGTPTLSFSGVAGLGLQSDGSLYVSPAGTGALQAQATTSSTVGGNARGANAVDWQTLRTAASQVASATLSFVGGGTQNTGGAFNATVVAGANNFSQGNYNFIGGGQSNTANGNFLQTYSVIGGGRSNTANGYHNFIGAGFTNSGTSISAVTTQSSTMNGTTAVTLSGSNANIKVGQFITGTSIADQTYVAAISGTALTLSQAASGSSTSTLSFYTPHGVVVGGGNNQATGSYSFIGGGGDAGTAANRNVASGDWSFVGGGLKNTASGLQSFVGGGYGNTANTTGAVVVGGGSYGAYGYTANQATGTSAFVGAGYGNVNSGYAAGIAAGSSNGISNNYAFIGAGGNNNANSQYAVITGGSYGTSRSITGYQVFPAHNSPITGAAGVSQAALLILGRQTTDATPTVLASDTSAASGTNQVILPNNSAYFFTGEVVSGVTGGGNTKGWTIEGVIKRGANAAATTLVGSTVTSMYADVGAATWTIALAADTTNGGLRITFTGQASTTIRTVCQIRTTEMTY